MELDEAILHCKNKAKELKDEANACCSIPAEDIADCIECAREHLQLAEWLEELKRLREVTEQADKMIPLSVAKGIVNRFIGYIDEDMVYRIKLALDKWSEETNNATNE